MGFPVHKFLEEFAIDGAQDQVVHTLRPRTELAEVDKAARARVDEAYSRGFEEGQSATEAHLLAEMATLRSDYDERLERSSAQFCDALAERLTSDLRRQISELHDSLSDQLASALLPVMRHVLTDASIRELAASLGRLLDEHDAMTVEIRGSQELIDRVSRRLHDISTRGDLQETPRFRCVVDDAAELRVTANDTIIEARLMNWIERITMAVE
ncbi:MAG: hypothetical protein AB7L90_17470 [Hyphomicrobiaceae bacterium]|uniref:hypothetical protein n=1 Tax=Pseudorhodoplanes sp. TaxID=1934341 RepID=UPI003D139DF5